MSPSGSGVSMTLDVSKWYLSLILETVIFIAMIVCKYLFYENRYGWLQMLLVNGLSAQLC